MTTFTLLAFAPIVIFVLSIAGLVLLTLGIRGRPVLSAPRCAKCGYDLRNVQFMAQQDAIGNCPECGINLADPDAVTFGKWRRQPRRIVLGVVVMILPWVAAFGLTLYVRSQAQRRVIATAGVASGPQAKAAMTTPALLASLPANLDSPWDWQELETRMRTGKLSLADVDAAFGVLIADLNAKRAAGKRREPLHWADRFINPAIKRGAVSQQQVVALGQAYYGMSPRLTMRGRVRADEPIPLILNEHEPWNLPGMQAVWCLTSMVADGSSKLSPRMRYPNVPVRKGETPPPLKPDQLSGSGRDGELDLLVPHELPPGEHEITMTFEMGMVPENVTMRGLDGRPGTPSKWPAPVAQWQSVVKRKITVRPKDQSPIDLITDPAQNPFTSATASIGVEEALVRPASKGVDLVIKFKFNGVLTPPVSYRIAVRAGGETIEYGTMVAGKTSRHATETYSNRKIAPAIAPDVKKIDILLTPDTTPAERYPDIEAIWGLPHQIKDVPLQRFDLGDSGTDGGAAGADGKTPAAQAG